MSKYVENVMKFGYQSMIGHKMLKDCGLDKAIEKQIIQAQLDILEQLHEVVMDCCDLPNLKGLAEFDTTEFDGRFHDMRLELKTQLGGNNDNKTTANRIKP